MARDCEGGVCGERRRVRVNVAQALEESWADRERRERPSWQNRRDRGDGGRGNVPHRVFLTGATGYVGGRLAPELLLAGHSVRCLARSPEKLKDRVWTDPYALALAEMPDADAPAQQLEIVKGDASDEDALAEHMRGCDVAYYLIHSMATARGGFAAKDRELAETFARAAERGGVGRIIYLGGLGDLNEDLSEHLRSRRETEEALRTTSVPVTVFRAAMIIGSGSASFEVLRYLVERLPVMVTPKWVRTECQPIAIRNVLHYLVACLDTPETVGETLDIGGTDVLTYDDLMRLFQEERELPRRLVIPVPVLSPRLSSYWLHLTTPVSTDIARPLAEGLRNRVVCRDMRAAELMPQRLVGAREAIGLALKAASLQRVETRWSAAGVVPGDPDWAGGTLYSDVKTKETEASAAAVYAAICRLGGGHGWYAVNWLWRIRGLMDQLVGGPGLRRGRRDPETLRYGEALDFWRVIHLEKDRRLTLLAEMKVPGLAQLEYRIEPREGGGCVVTQEARFQPKGLLGIAYWFAVLPLHGIVFPAMLGGIVRAAEKGRTGSVEAAETA